MSEPQIILASASPRRLELLQQIGLQPRVIPANIDEQVITTESALAFVERMALEKAAKIATDFENSVVIGSDTCIDLDGVIIGKPIDFEDAMNIMKKLSARSHVVHTSVALSRAGVTQSKVVSSEVFFRPISESEISRYWQSGEPEGKAGAYAIQGLGAVFVEKIIGSYSSIMGLPLFETSAMLNEFGVSVIPQKEFES